MGQFLKLTLAALLGGLTAAGLILLALPSSATDGSAATRAVDARPATPPIHLASYREGLVSENADSPPSLKVAARKATAVTVHITARPKNMSVEAVKRLFSPREEPRSRREGQGSGVIYNTEGYIITNSHVVRNAGEIIVRTADRSTYPATLIGEDTKSDLAVIKIEGERFPFLPLADSDLIEPGEWVLAVGSPLGLRSTVTAGIVSAKGRSISLMSDLDAIESFIQTDAAVNPGNSGGPLVTASGSLVGINTAIASQTGRFQGYSFAIPSNLVRRVVDDIIDFGSYRRAFLGVGISTLTTQDIRRLNISGRSAGVLVDEVVAGGSAEAAGVQLNDVIVRVGQRTIRDLPELTEIIGRAKVGESLKLTVIRDGSPLELIVPMLPMPE